MQKFLVPAHRFAQFTAGLVKVSKKGAAVGVDVANLVNVGEKTSRDVTEFLTIRHGRGDFEERKREIEIECYPVEIEEFNFKIEGFKIVGKIETRDGLSAFNSFSKKDYSDSAFQILCEESGFTESQRCDHCGYNRARVIRYVVFRESDAELMLVGSSCARDYLGHSSAYIERLFALRERIFDFINACESDGESYAQGLSYCQIRNGSRFNLGMFMSIVQHATDLHERWLGGGTTSELIKNYLESQIEYSRFKEIPAYGPHGKISSWTPIEPMDSSDFVTWIKTEADDDFFGKAFERMANAEFSGVFGRDAGIVGYAIYNFLNLAKVDSSEGEALGDVGEWIDNMTLEVFEIRQIEDRFSYSGGSKNVYLMKDADGRFVEHIDNSFKLSKYGVGDTIENVRAKIKKSYQRGVWYGNQKVTKIVTAVTHLKQKV